MKRLLLLFIVLISVISSLAAEDSTTDPNYTKAFFLLLNKNGTDQVWFQKTTDGGADPDSKISINIFPLIDASSANPVAEDTVYLYWIKQSSNNVKIKITFVGNESRDSNSSTFMMWSASTKDDANTTENESEKKGINFDVTITDSSAKTIGSFTRTLSERTTMLPDDNRSFTFTPDEKETDSDGNSTNKYTSPLTIKMKINPTQYDSETEKYYWATVDEQYVGYIKATIEDAT